MLYFNPKSVTKNHDLEIFQIRSNIGEMHAFAIQPKYCMRAAIRKVSVTGIGKLISSCYYVLQADLKAAIDAMPNAVSRQTAKLHSAEIEAAEQGRPWMRPDKTRKRERQYDTTDFDPYPSQVRHILIGLLCGCTCWQ